MKKVGILFGKEDTFPWAFIDKVNQLGKGKVVAEPVKIDKVQQGIHYGYDVIIDRISQDVPFYRAYLKNAALMGTTVINNPFWFSADEKFFNNCLMTQIGIPVPKTVLLPSKERPDDTDEQSFRNLDIMDWDYIFDYIGFPAYMKPYSGGGWKSVYKIEDKADLWEKLEETGQLVMMFQEEIKFTDYYRVYYIGQKYVHVMPYAPDNQPHLRYQTEPKTTGKEYDKLIKQITEMTLTMNKALGYDFNTVEFALRDGVPYAIDFCNPAPDADLNSVGQENFDWVVEHTAKMAVEKALENKSGKSSNVSWGDFIKNSVSGKKAASAPTTKPLSGKTSKKVETKKKETEKAASATKVKAVAKPVVKKAKAEIKPAKKKADENMASNAAKRKLKRK